MPPPPPSSGTKRPKKKRQTPSRAGDDALSTLNVSGLDDHDGGAMGGGGGRGGGGGDDMMDCLDAMAAAQLPAGDDRDDAASAAGHAPTGVDGHDIDGCGVGAGTTTPAARTTLDSPPPPPPPPGLHRIPNARIELARHLRTADLSTFLLRSCPGLRMPTFERWLLDSKLEETRRLRTVVEGWIDDPATRRTTVRDGGGKPKAKKKYGRAARYHREDANGEGGGDDARSTREGSRHEKDCELLSEAEGRIPPASSSSSSSSTREGAATSPDDRDGRVERWIRHADRDPILPHRAMETDPSCARLSGELVAVMMTSDDCDSGEERRRAAAAKAGRAAAEIVRDLCHRTAEACAEVRNLEIRLGRYHKFSWDVSAPPGSGGGPAGGGRKRKSGAVAGGAADKILVEWQDDGEVCSLVYVPRKRKFTRPKSQRGGFRGVNDRGDDDDDDDNDADADAGPSLPAPNRPKPFVVKINAAHYRKLRAMFDSCYGAPPPSSSSASGERAAHAYHAALFSLIVRYSALSGGQQINDFRGGGMQGAVHDAVFDTLSRWFGGGGGGEGGGGGGGGCAPALGGGIECFASPFNSALPSYLSAFPSPDLDGHFGSRGDFFQSSSALLDRVFPPGGPPGWFELNPPFSPGVMTKMADGIGNLLETHERKGSDVTCIVVIPTVRGSKMDDGPCHRSKVKEKVEKKKRKRFADGDEGGDDVSNDANLTSIVNNAAKHSFNQLVNSPYCRSHIILPAREHGFLEGGQHLRPTKFKESQCSTSVIVLRSKSWMDPDDARIFESELREAFASRHAVELEQRKGARRKES